MIRNNFFILIGTVLLSCTACRALPMNSSEAPTAATAVKASLADDADPYQPVQTAPYYPDVAPGTEYVGYQQPHTTSGECGCGRRHGMPGNHGCVEAFHFSDQFPVDDPHTQWAPDGVARPWPHDEYLWDGGDRNRDVRVTKDKTVYGLDLEDTVVHYDTYNGKTEVSASNRVPLYAPRFAAVRHIVAMEEQNKSERLALADKPLEVGLKANTDRVTNFNQPTPAVAQLGVNKTQTFRERNAGLTADHARSIAQAHNGLEPYEQFQIISQGIMDAGEKPRLSQMALNAITWVDNKAVQVVIDGEMAFEAVNNEKIGEVTLYDRQGKPQMRIVKIADRREAKPGEIVKFTLRFDNIGHDKVERVVIIDNLTTRLEYVPETQECSHEHKFVPVENEGEALALRWELAQPIRAGEGGIIKFQCRVR
jgi:uncharacterized repeat protein (TIGR01451 family)